MLLMLLLLSWLSGSDIKVSYTLEKTQLRLCLQNCFSLFLFLFFFTQSI